MMMVDAVQWALRDDPRYRFAFFGHSKLTVPADATLPPGRMDYALLGRDDVVARIVAPRTDWRNQ
jgi:hypothetical protein